jgi:hypothetical protein
LHRSIAFGGNIFANGLVRQNIAFENSNGVEARIDKTEVLKNMFFATFDSHRSRAHGKKLFVGNGPSGVLGSHASVNGVIGGNLDQRPRTDRVVGGVWSDFHPVGHADSGKILTGQDTTQGVNAEVQDGRSVLIAMNADSPSVGVPDCGLADTKCLVIKEQIGRRGGYVFGGFGHEMGTFQAKNMEFEIGGSRRSIGMAYVFVEI